ncbi:MAG: Gfo/Idh/MocA family oxidoreductase, partial [Bacteroidia bacterium]|nr:Gfo/Idh/MocA family oxidoreductase [Bacteroidia bacterium]
MNTSPIKFAVAGCGHIGKRHAEMVKRNPEAELVAVIDSDKNKQTALADLYPGVPFFESIDSFLQSAI